jgi:hypothetical protein
MRSQIILKINIKPQMSTCELIFNIQIFNIQRPFLFLVNCNLFILAMNGISQGKQEAQEGSNG